MYRIRRRVFLVVVPAVFLCSTGQQCPPRRPGEATGSLSGSVVAASSQEPIGGAVVSVQLVDLQATADSRGQYLISAVPVGSHVVVATAGGYKSQSRSVDIVEGQTASLEFALEAVETGDGVYYVSVDGDDQAPGTIDAPWRTIQQAAETMVAGDRVYIRGGTYTDPVRTTRGGSSDGGYITFSAYPGETPVLDGTGITQVNNVLILTHSYIALEGLEICNLMTGGGIWIENAPGHIRITDCVVHHVSEGIGIADGAHDFELSRVVMHHFTAFGVDVSPAWGDGCYNGEFNDCVAHTWNDPEQGHMCDGFALSHQGDQHDFVLNRCEAYGVGDGFVFGGRNVTVNRCAVRQCQAGFKVWGDAVRLTNCMSYGNAFSNLEIGWTGVPGTVTCRNCIFMDSPEYNVWMEGPGAGSGGDLLRMYNCIVAGGDNIGLLLEKADADNYEGDYNVFHMDEGDRAIVVDFDREYSVDDISAGDWTTYSGQDSHSVVSVSAEALFVDPAGFDLHSPADSPAVDNGTDVDAPSEDYEGNARPQGSGFDIGAYER